MATIKSKCTFSQNRTDNSTAKVEFNQAMRSEINTIKKTQGFYLLSILMEIRIR